MADSGENAEISATSLAGCIMMINVRKWLKLRTTILITCVAVMIYIVVVLLDVVTYTWQLTDFANSRLFTQIRRHECILSASFDPKLVSKRKIALVMVYGNSKDGGWGDELMNRVIENRKLYCNLHGYDLINANSCINPTKPIAWSKILAVKQFLSAYDYVFYIDMDIVIMDMKKPLETFIDISPITSDIIVTNDWNGLNTGVWLARNSTWTHWFLKTAWSQDHLTQKRSINGISHPFEYEQRAFHFLLDSDVWQKRKLPKYRGNSTAIRTHFHTLPQCAFNSYAMHPWDTRGSRYDSQYVPGDFLIHFAGKKGTKKTNLMNYYLDHAKQTS